MVCLLDHDSYVCWFMRSYNSEGSLRTKLNHIQIFFFKVQRHVDKGKRQHSVPFVFPTRFASTLPSGHMCTY